MKLHYHALGPEGEPYPTLIRVLTTASGVYVIRDKRTKRVLYVGSSGGKLYSTLTRHFQGWRRAKKFWSNQYGKAHDPGVVYKRTEVEVAFDVMPKGADHLKREAELIHELEPRDNLTKNPDGRDRDDLEEAPF